jgi:hypothetical protein
MVEPRSPEDALSPGAARIGPGSWQRLRGSYSSTAPAFRRPLGVGDTPLPPLPPAISTPDIGLQIRDTRGLGPQCLADEGRQQIVDALRAAIAPKYPNADIRSTCQDAGTPQEAASFGIWTRAALGEIDSEARDVGVGSLDLLEGVPTLPVIAGFFVNVTFIRAVAQQVWDDMPVKTLNGQGQVDPTGPIYLTSLTVTLEPPDAVVTQIDGVDTRPWPDVNFTITITDRIASKPFELTCVSDPPKLHADTDWLAFLDFAFGVATFVNPWFAIGFGIFLYETVEVTTASVSQQSGVGCAVRQLLPAKIAIAGGQDVFFNYDTATVATGGLFLGAALSEMPRTPSASIQGPAQLAANISDGSVGGTFQVFTDDLRGQLTYIWSTDGDVVSPGLRATPIVFTIGGAQVGAVMTKNVAVSVTDEDGLMASAAFTVEIHVTDMSDETIPAICLVKPWLPNCSPPGG